jgi:transmembrane sensor
LVTKEAIERFFSNKSTPQEAAEVHAYIEANPEILRELEIEWTEFQQSEILPDQLSHTLWQDIHRKTLSIPMIGIHFKRFAAAATVILLLGVGLYFFAKTRRIPEANHIMAQNNLKKFINTSERVMTVSFVDSSVAHLTPGSSIIYTEPFDSLNRQVSLKGEAFFSVKRSAGLPFTVTSDSIVTTVLGTKFTVKCHEFESFILVTLHEGNVSVAPVTAAYKSNPKTYFLKPGDVFSYNRKTSEVTLNSLKPENKSLIGGMATDKNSGNGAMQSENWYMFNNQPVVEVFAQLEILYKAKITYNPADIKGMSFIGKIDKSDSLETVLQSFAFLNDLLLTRQGNMYALIKK